MFLLTIPVSLIQTVKMKMFMLNFSGIAASFESGGSDEMIFFDSDPHHL